MQGDPLFEVTIFFPNSHWPIQQSYSLFYLKLFSESKTSLKNTPPLKGTSIPLFLPPQLSKSSQASKSPDSVQCLTLTSLLFEPGIVHLLVHSSNDSNNWSWPGWSQGRNSIQVFYKDSITPPILCSWRLDLEQNSRAHTRHMDMGFGCPKCNPLFPLLSSPWQPHSWFHASCCL